MADYFVASGGSNTSPYDTWAKAATSLATALAAATSDGDRVIIQYDGVPSGDAEVSTDTVWQAGANIAIISSTNSGTATVTPTVMGVSNWIGCSSGNCMVTLGSSAGTTVYVYGLTVRSGATGADYVRLYCLGASAEFRADNCYFWVSGNDPRPRVYFGTTLSGANCYITLNDCTFRFANASQAVGVGLTTLTMRNCTVSADGTAPSVLFDGMEDAGGPLICYGCDFSTVNMTLVESWSTGHRLVEFIQCKFPVSYILAASNTWPGKAGSEVYVYDCDSGGTHINFAHANGLGTTVIDTGLYANDNLCDADLSWKIVGTAAATPWMPYESPWIDVYHDGTSAITPYLECVRSGSATAYQDDEVWSEWTYKGTSGSTRCTSVNDGMALTGTPADQASSSKGAGDWTGENVTSWFGKLGPSSSITPAEAGHIRARVCVAGEVTVFVDPQIRGLS